MGVFCDVHDASRPVTCKIPCFYLCGVSSCSPKLTIEMWNRGILEQWYEWSCEEPVCMLDSLQFVGSPKERSCKINQRHYQRIQPECFQSGIGYRNMKHRYIHTNP